MNAVKPSLGDRYAEISVVLLTALALLAGWWLMDSVQNRSLTYETAGLKAEIPAGWIQSSPSSETLLETRARSSSGGFQTTYLVSKMLLTPDSGINETISLLSLQRGQELVAYRLLDQQRIKLGTRQGVQVTYVYVESDPNITHLEAPVVVHGEDFIFFTVDGAVIVSYRASEEDFNRGLTRFYRFLESIQY